MAFTTMKITPFMPKHVTTTMYYSNHEFDMMVNNHMCNYENVRLPIGYINTSLKSIFVYLWLQGIIKL